MVDDPAPWWAICLCAGWCGVCRDWHPAFAAAARAHPQWRFAWVDVEDEAETLGDIEIETFPTLLIARADEALFLGPVPPSVTQFERLFTALQAQPLPSPTLPAGAGALLQRLHQGVLPRTRV